MASRSPRGYGRPNAPTDPSAMAGCDVFDYPPIVKVSCQVPENTVLAVSCVPEIVTRR